MSQLVAQRDASQALLQCLQAALKETQVKVLNLSKENEALKALNLALQLQKQKCSFCRLRSISNDHLSHVPWLNMPGTVMISLLRSAHWSGKDSANFRLVCTHWTAVHDAHISSIRPSGPALRSCRVLGGGRFPSLQELDLSKCQGVTCECLSSIAGNSADCCEF